MAVLAFLGLYSCAAASQTARWSEEKANQWYAQQPWLVGSNYTPQSAINQLELWQDATFDPAEIDKELGWAESLGMNTMRVFLHDLLWQSRGGRDGALRWSGTGRCGGESPPSPVLPRSLWGQPPKPALSERSESNGAAPRSEAPLPECAGLTRTAGPRWGQDWPRAWRAPCR